MRGFLLALLAGLLAVTAQPAAALCADDGNGGCQAMAAPAVAFDVRGDCEDSAGGLCLAGDGNETNILAGNDLHLNVTNRHGHPIDFEVFLTQRVDDPVSDTGEPERLRADRIVLLQAIAPGETRYAKLAIDGNTSMLRFQALSADAKQAELDIQALHVMYMTGGAPEVDPGQDGTDQSHQPVVDERKDAPMLGAGAVAVTLGAVVALAAFFGLRKYD